MSELIAPYHAHLEDFGRELAEWGGQGLMVLDATWLETIEEEYGSDAFEEVRNRVLRILVEQRGKDYRSEDVLTLDAIRGLRFVLFLHRKRRRNSPISLADLKSVQSRLASSLVPNLARAAFPYRSGPPRVEIGYAMALYNPLVHPDRILRRALDDAMGVAAHDRQAARLLVREKLQDIIVQEKVVTAYQPILRLKDRTVLAFEALSRGPRGSGLERADALFGAATDHDLLIELDRLCRRRAFLSSGRIPSNARIFVNTLPATIRDPQFRGKPLIDFLDRALVPPNRIVIEITEKLVIENYDLFRETMAYFTALGMSFAVDDVGSGYSGLESIARLKPQFLKIDIGLVRNVNESLVNREMVRAIIALGNAIGASVIAEGIETQAEVETLEQMGIELGQGYLLARPDAGPQ